LCYGVSGLMTSKVKHLMTVDDLHAIPYDECHRFELIEGKLYVSCPPGLSHQLVLANIQFELENYLRQNRIGRIVPGPGVVFSKYNSVIPDIVYVNNERWSSIVTKDHFNGAPGLIVEILSSGASCSRDLKLKRKLYCKYGVQEYWIVDGASRAVTTYRLQDNSLKKASTLKVNGVLESQLFPGLSLNLHKIFLTGSCHAFLT